MTEPDPGTTPPAGKRKGCKGCLVAALVIAGVPVLLLVAYGVWGVYANDRAQRLATEFCAGVKPGDTEAQLKDLAAQASPGNQFATDDGYRFLWYGMIFNASECRVKLAGGRVASKEVQHFDD